MDKMKKLDLIYEVQYLKYIKFRREWVLIDRFANYQNAVNMCEKIMREKGIDRSFFRIKGKEGWTK